MRCSHPALAPLAGAAFAHGGPTCPSKVDGTLTMMAADAILAIGVLVAAAPDLHRPLPEVCRFMSPYIPISGVALQV
jgi:hypothetical protein